MFECRICGRKYETLEEAMVCEQQCYVKQKKAKEQHQLEMELAKEKERQNLSKADEERIQKEYEQLTKDIKHHVDTYGERVNLDNSKTGNIDSPFYIRIRDPFWEFNHIFEGE